MLIIDDDNYLDFVGEDGIVDVNGQKFSCATQPRVSAPGTLEFASPPNFPLIPENEWASRIKDREQAGATNEAIMKIAGCDILNQDRLNYCWMFSGVGAMMGARALQGEAHVDLSPCSAAAPITNFQNVGNSMEPGLRWMVENGVASTKFVPEVTLNRRDFKTGWEEDALKYRVESFYDLMNDNDGKMFARQMTLLLTGHLIPIGLWWWKHAVFCVDPVHLGGNDFGIKIWNSWTKNWGEQGTAVLSRRKGTANEAYAIYKVRVAA